MRSDHGMITCRLEINGQRLREACALISAPYGAEMEYFQYLMPRSSCKSQKLVEAVASNRVEVGIDLRAQMHVLQACSICIEV